MISTDLFSKILLEPGEVCNQLKVVTGYASPAMANKHFELLPKHISVDVIVGMVPKDGIGFGAHTGFVNLCNDEPRFRCSYVKPGFKAVHAKSYIWLKDDHPVVAFTGSGNYSQNTFMDGTVEAFAVDDPAMCIDFYQRISGKSISCKDLGDNSGIKFYKEFYRRRAILDFDDKQKVPVPDVSDSESVVLSLLDTRTDETHTRSGLNWGQRDRREPNQAYIPVPSVIARKNFFPDRANHFNLITDDGQSFDCVIAQDNDKAIETTRNNSLLGVYFRNRIGVELGSYVRKEDLLNYGRTNVEISKVDDETYFMDFSVTK